MINHKIRQNIIVDGMEKPVLYRFNWFFRWPSIAEYIAIEYIKTMSWNAVTPLQFSSWLNINRDFIYSWQWVASSSESRPCITMYSKCIDELFLLFFLSSLQWKNNLSITHCKSISKMNFLQTKMKYSWIPLTFFSV